MSCVLLYVEVRLHHYHKLPQKDSLISNNLTRKANSHIRWRCFVEGMNKEDLTRWVSQVVFTLDPSFSEPVRGVARRFDTLKL